MEKSVETIAGGNACSGDMSFLTSSICSIKSQSGFLTNRILPTGVDIALFQPKEKNNLLTMVYHETTSQRHSTTLPMLQPKTATEEQNETQLLLIGRGDASNSEKHVTER